MNKTIAIAGLGWLGKPFALLLQNLGYRVKGSVTSIEKAGTLQRNGLEAFPVEISENGISGEVEALLKDIDCLVIMIPPGLRKNTGADYVAKMTHFLTEIEKAAVQKVIVVSSTAVYSDAQGTVTEKDIPVAENNAAKQLIEVEKLFFTSEKLQTTIVRFGGLLGGKRQPVRYLAGRKNLNNGNAPVNLINRKDCIGILSEIIKKEAFGHIFNAVAPFHPLKKHYYTQKATELNLEPPSYSEEDDLAVYKKVTSVNVPEILGYAFKQQP
ncbi:NAD(P)H-binding protein [Marixanthomonas ophiurae]|uniref:SDR family NAD(P)-dependent oxidoreductase n=1 Tax=Marixanthomonas ophiurae TaxID=387659 RepID=A0A3E1QB24_9FLAO|nr:NAD(P)H-binding protein [Marixanthomonas ophiurae]RFN59304.1 SDR family NAD(P)-dependent oxidoreductase [Marixanthomonas ophiurae]